MYGSVYYESVTFYIFPVVRQEERGEEIEVVHQGEVVHEEGEEMIAPHLQDMIEREKTKS